MLNLLLLHLPKNANEDEEDKSNSIRMWTSAADVSKGRFVASSLQTKLACSKLRWGSLSGSLTLIEATLEVPAIAFGFSIFIITKKQVAIG